MNTYIMLLSYEQHQCSKHKHIPLSCAHVNEIKRKRHFDLLLLLRESVFDELLLN